MKRLLADHEKSTFLKPGEAVFSRRPIVVGTILGSCVAVTMYSSKKRVGAICHAMLPSNRGKAQNYNYVDTAIKGIYRRMIGHGVGPDMVVKIFGGAQVLGYADEGERKTIGEQNLLQARKTLEELGLSFVCADVGGKQGRKLYFSTLTGDVYLRKIKRRDLI